MGIAGARRSFEIGQVPVAIFGVALGSSFFENDFNSRTAIVVENLVHGRSRGGTECYSSLAEAPRSDDQKKQEPRYRERDVAFRNDPSLVRLKADTTYGRPMRSSPRRRQATRCPDVRRARRNRS